MVLKIFPYLVIPAGFLLGSQVLHAMHFIGSGYVAALISVALLFVRPKAKEATCRSKCSDRDMLHVLMLQFPDAIMIKRADGVWQFINDQAVKLFGVERRRLVGTTSKVIPDSHREYHELLEYCCGLDEGVWSAGEPYVELRKVIGGSNPQQINQYEVRKIPVFSSKGERKHMLTIFRDVTDLHDLRTEYEQSLIGLKDQERQLVEFSSMIERLREGDRAAIAMDVHDSLGPTLTAFRLTIDAMETKYQRQDPAQTVQQDLANLSDICDKSIHIVRQLSRRLIGGDTSVEGTLADAMKAEIDMIAGDWLMVDFMNKIAYSADVETQDAAIAILREALTNTVKHSRASAAMVFASVSAGGLTMTIEDNGVIQEQKGSGVGMRSMSERAKRAGGSISFGRGIMGGLKICLVIPEKRNSNDQDLLI